MSRARNSLVPPPRDFTTPDAIEQLTRERMIASVTHGRPGTAMVGWTTQLSAAEIETVVDYIRETFMKPRASPELARGRELYARNCASCHGRAGQGASANGFTSPQAAAQLTRERMLTAVTQGRPGTAMMAFGPTLAAADIAAIVDFVRGAFMMPSIEGLSGTRAHAGSSATQSKTSTPTADMEAAMPKGLKGNPGRGGKFYQANCATCHGERGDGQGRRAYFIRPKPRNFLEAPAKAAYNRPFLFAAITTGKLGTEMPAWSKVLSDQQIADVAEYVYGAFIRPPTNGAARKP